MLQLLVDYRCQCIPCRLADAGDLIMAASNIPRGVIWAVSKYRTKVAPGKLPLEKVENWRHDHDQRRMKSKIRER